MKPGFIDIALGHSIPDLSPISFPVPEKRIKKYRRKEMMFTKTQYYKNFGLLRHKKSSYPQKCLTLSAVLLVTKVPDIENKSTSLRLY
ncbi:hypothetical protein CEXT_261941 [Caerostris extrusa]|uniref:Uncharacterized protein n=1 Tax=Caerostris extrusa TaxID=172846 RepID=A0AAV4T5Z0_CAEEX|nr:hypothetical protein CEXT_261941 [Caerostris extrusa]